MRKVIGSKQKAESDKHELSSLLFSIAQKDEHALERLYVSIRRGVYALAYAQTRDRAIAEDVIQETLLYIWLHASDFKRADHPIGWIYRIARHRAIDLYRRSAREVPMDRIQGVTGNEMHTTSDLDDELTIKEGIDQLDELEAQVFTLKAVVGLHHIEIAEVLEIPVRSSKYRYRNAIQSLQAFLAIREPQINREGGQAHD